MSMLPDTAFRTTVYPARFLLSISSCLTCRFIFCKEYFLAVFGQPDYFTDFAELHLSLRNIAVRKGLFFQHITKPVCSRDFRSDWFQTFDHCSPFRTALVILFKKFPRRFSSVIASSHGHICFVILYHSFVLETPTKQSCTTVLFDDVLHKFLFAERSTYCTCRTGLVESKIRILVGYLERNDYILIAHINQTSYPQTIKESDRWVLGVVINLVFCSQVTSLYKGTESNQSANIFHSKSISHNSTRLQSWNLQAMLGCMQLCKGFGLIRS